MGDQIILFPSASPDAEGKAGILAAVRADRMPRSGVSFGTARAVQLFMRTLPPEGQAALLAAPWETIKKVAWALPQELTPEELGLYLEEKDDV